VNINLHIERLILDGVDIHPSQRHLLHASVQTELTRLLTEGGVAPQLTGGGALPHVASPALQLHSGHGPAEFGRQIAGAGMGG
jgi:hypothetical protein